MFEHEKMSREEREKLYGAHHDSVRGFEQGKTEEPPREQKEVEARNAGTSSGTLKRILFIVLAVLAMAVVKNVIRYAFRSAVKSRNSAETFDEAWNKMAKQFGEQFPYMKKKVIAEGVEEVKAEFEKQGCQLTEADIQKLESLMTASIAGVDPERYFKDNKGTFLKKIGKSEDELNRMVAAAKSKEDVESLKKLIGQASYDIGFEFGKSLRKPLSDAVDQFVEYMVEQQKAKHSR